MAKRRLLKKEVSYIAGDLFTEALFCKLYIPGVDEEKADILLSKILDVQDKFRQRAGKTDGKDNKKIVRAYYNDLWTKLIEEVNTIGKEIEALNK